jgi:DNA-binding NtrC family response regulator
VREVLVVDDNVPLAENLAEILSDAQLADAIVASSGTRALELLRSDRFDVMLTDMRMPEMGGTELIRRAREIDPELPVLVITAFTSDDDVAQALREGLLMVFGKPMPTTSLIQFICKATCCVNGESRRCSRTRSPTSIRWAVHPPSRLSTFDCREARTAQASRA